MWGRAVSEARFSQIRISKQEFSTFKVISFHRDHKAHSRQGDREPKAKVIGPIQVCARRVALAAHLNVKSSEHLRMRAHVGKGAPCRICVHL